MKEPRGDTPAIPLRLEAPMLPWPPAARRALSEPPHCGEGNPNLWEEICDVVLALEADPEDAETIHRWLRDRAEEELLAQLGRGNQAGLVAWACRLAPRMIWRLPCSIGPPPRSYHRLIAAILLPRRLQLLRRELTGVAFRWRVFGTGPAG